MPRQRYLYFLPILAFSGGFFAPPFSGPLAAQQTAQTSPPTANFPAQKQKQQAEEFFKLVKWGDIAAVTALLSSAPELKEPISLAAALRVSIRARDEAMAKFLISQAGPPAAQAATVNAVDAEGRNALFHAVDANAPGLVTYLLSKGGDTSKKTPYSNLDSRYAAQNPIQRAFTSDNPAVLQLLLESADPALSKALHAPTSSDFGVNAMLPVAVAAGNVNLVKALLGFKPNLRDPYYLNDIWKAVAHSQSQEVAELLLASGAVLDPRPADPLNQTAASALLEACRWNRPQLAQYFLSKGADINFAGGISQDRGGRETPLTLAVACGNRQLVELLVARGANLNPRLNFGSGPLATALGRDDWAMAQFLLENGANLGGEAPGNIERVLHNQTLSPQAGQDAAPKGTAARPANNLWHYAALFGTPATLDSLLAVSNAEAQNAAGSLGQTPLFWAVRSGNNAAVNWFLEHGANARHVDQYGQTALHVAAFGGSAELIERLVKGGASVDATVEKGPHGDAAYGPGITPLHRAALYGNLGALGALLKNGARIDAPDALKRTPLHMAVMAGQTTAVKTLLERGAERADGPSLMLAAAGPLPWRNSTSHQTPQPFPTLDRAGTVALLASNGVPAGDKNNAGSNALHMAVTTEPSLAGIDQSFGAIRRLRLRQDQGETRAALIGALIKAGANPNERARVDASRQFGLITATMSPVLGPTALHLAVERLDVAAVKALLDGGADATLEDGVGRTPLDMALRRGENSPQRNDEPFASGRKMGFSQWDKPEVLMLDGAARREIIALLRARGGNRIGRGPFLNAVNWGAGNWVKNTVAVQPGLLTAKANYEAFNDRTVILTERDEPNEASAAQLALTGGHRQLSLWLVNNGAYTGPTGWAQTNLLFPAVAGKDWIMVDTLLKKGVNWEADSSRHHTPLHQAVERGDAETVRELLKRKIPLDARSKDGHTALKLATIMRKDEIAALLRNAGASE